MFNFQIDFSRYLGCSMCGRALKELTFSEQFNLNGHNISTILIHSGFELIIKSIIAEKIDIGLLFPNKDKSNNRDYIISCDQAYKYFKQGFRELGLDKYDGIFEGMKNFRNGMLHKAMPQINPKSQFIHEANPIFFWYYIIEPVMNSILGESILTYFYEYDPDGLEYFPERLEREGINLDLSKYEKILPDYVYSSLTTQLNA